MQNYKILLHPQAYQKATQLLEEIKNKSITAGSNLYFALHHNIPSSTEQLLEKLINSKQPQIFAESSIKGDGTDWTLSELSILGDISMAVPVSIYDNGRHQYPHIHGSPFEGILLYTPGALLRNDTGNTPADWQEVAPNGSFSYQGYYQLYERRLLPLFYYANMEAKRQGKKAFITVPGLGCGLFAGPYKGNLGKRLEQVLIDLLFEYGQKWPNIQAVYYDPYHECSNDRHQIHAIDFLIRPLLDGNSHKSQLCHPSDFEEKPSDNFSDCLPFSMVAWDHVSWPGNDYWLGSRATDDGVKAAATSSMFSLTGIEGIYSPQTFKYLPPSDFKDWNQVVLQQKLTIKTADNIIILPKKI